MSASSDTAPGVPQTRQDTDVGYAAGTVVSLEDGNGDGIVSRDA